MKRKIIKEFICEYGFILDRTSKDHGFKYKLGVSTYQFKVLSWLGSWFVFKTHHAWKRERFS